MIDENESLVSKLYFHLEYELMKSVIQVSTIENVTQYNVYRAGAREESFTLFVSCINICLICNYISILLKHKAVYIGTSS